MIHVTVSGFVNETFKGSDKEVEKYLIALKQRQNISLSSEDQKLYKSFLKRSKDYSKSSYPNNLKIDDLFRERNSHLGLKIVITKVKPPENKFF